MTYLQADSMVENGRPLKELIPLFPTKIAAYEYFAGYMTKRFAVPDSHCAMCGRQCEESPIGFTWRANLHTTKTILLSFLFTALALFASGLYSRWVVINFKTFHRLCSQCQRRHRTRSFAVGFLHKALFALLMLLLFLTVPIVIFSLAMPFIAPEGTWIAIIGAVIGIGLIAIVAQGFEICRKSLIPLSLRPIGQFPFFLYAVRDTRVN